MAVLKYIEKEQNFIEVIWLIDFFKKIVWQEEHYKNYSSVMIKKKIVNIISAYPCSVCVNSYFNVTLS